VLSLPTGMMVSQSRRVNEAAHRLAGKDLQDRLAPLAG
jgi:hypothetical protein